MSREEKVIDALGHSFTSYVSDNNATCNEDGTETAKCDRCEVTDTRTDEGSALGHDWAKEWTTDGTAHWHECSRCDEINDKANHSGGTATCVTPAECEVCGVEYGDLAEHIHVENAEEQYLASAATCTAKATYYKSCSVCGEAGDEIFEYGEPLGHAYGEPEWTWEGYTSATATFTCTRGCGEKQTATAAGSSITSVVTTPAECETEGLRTYTAKVMFGGEEYVTTTTETLEALGHDLEHHEAKPATCTEIGWNAYDACARCDYTTYEEIEALGHDWTKEWTTDGTAHWHECSRCDEISDKANHSGGEATCTNPAECEVCGAEYGSALGHTESEAVRENEVSASCTEVGSYDEVVYCSVCGEELSREEKVLDALGHSFTSYISDNNATCTEDNNATCTEDGTETAKCDRCEVTDTRTDEGSALGHDWTEEWTTDGTSHWHECSRCDEINDKAPHSGGTATCVTPAECEVCGAAYGDALGHDLEHHEAKPATCTENGWEAYDTCTRCDYTTYVEIAAKGHTFGPDATCTEDQVCLECGEVISAATGHIPGPDATCTENQTCSICGEILTPALGHSFTSYVSDNNATCLEDGTETAKCDRCEVTDTRTDEGSALGHDWTEEWTTDGTSHWHKCSRCDEINDKASHSGGTATCVTPAECEVCGVEYGEVLGHTEGEPVRENEVDASCTEAGSYDEVVYCPVCGEELSREEKVIDALGHDIVKHEGQAATCTQNGWNAYETCNRAGCGYTTYREIAATGHTAGAAATCTTPQTCTVCGATLVEALGHSFVDGYCTTCGVSDEEALENDREDAKTDLDDVAQNVKDEIDASDLPDDVKEDLKDKVDEIVNGAKDEVDGSTDFDDVNQAVEDAKEEIEDTLLNAEKDDAKSDLDEIVQNAKDEIDASDLPDDVKEDLKDKLDEIVNDTSSEIDSESTKEEVDAAVEDAKKEIEDVILNTEKDDAKSDLDEIVQNAKDEIDASDLSDEEKNELKSKLEEILSSAKEEIGNATSKEEVDAIVNDVRKDIEGLLNGSSSDEISEEKDVAVSDLENTVQNAKDEIDASDLSDEEKNELKGKLDEILSSAKEEIGFAATTEEIEEILTLVKEEIAALTENLTEGQPDASPLWPWLIAAVVISAALAAIFAWRHVRSVRGKGETIGVRSVVTIAVATILIFVLVIGIALLIFAMI